LQILKYLETTKAINRPHNIRLVRILLVALENNEKITMKRLQRPKGFPDRKTSIEQSKKQLD